MAQWFSIESFVASSTVRVCGSSRTSFSSVGLNVTCSTLFRGGGLESPRVADFLSWVGLRSGTYVFQLREFRCSLASGWLQGPPVRGAGYVFQYGRAKRPFLFSFSKSTISWTSKSVHSAYITLLYLHSSGRS